MADGLWGPKLTDPTRLTDSIKRGDRVDIRRKMEVITFHQLKQNLRFFHHLQTQTQNSLGNGAYMETHGFATHLYASWIWLAYSLGLKERS